MLGFKGKAGKQLWAVNMKLDKMRDNICSIFFKNKCITVNQDLKIKIPCKIFQSNLEQVDPFMRFLCHRASAEKHFHISIKIASSLNQKKNWKNRRSLQMDYLGMRSHFSWWNFDEKFWRLKLSHESLMTFRRFSRINHSNINVERRIEEKQAMQSWRFEKEILSRLRI